MRSLNLCVVVGLERRLRASEQQSVRSVGEFGREVTERDGVQLQLQGAVPGGRGGGAADGAHNAAGAAAGGGECGGGVQRERLLHVPCGEAAAVQPGSGANHP